MDGLTWGVFGLVYFGMIMGGLPGLALDRTGVALLGAIVLLAAGRLTPEQFWHSVDTPTLALLFGLMVLSAQFRLSGFYTAVVRRLASPGLSPRALLAVVVAAAGVLSALLANDIVCLAMAPVLIELAAQRRQDPRPLLLGLAAAANVGSAATLIGNPQNMLIGQVLRIPFGAFTLQAFWPALAGLGIVWGVLALVYRRRHVLPDGAALAISAPPWNGWQSAKGLGVLGALIFAFLFLPWPREWVALAGAGLLLCSRRLQTRELLGLVDWPLLVLFLGLFAVNGALRSTGNLALLEPVLFQRGLDPTQPAQLFWAGAVLSNIFSNVPAVMLLLPYVKTPNAGTVLAVASTLAGNLLIVGSIANMIVLDQASRLGVKMNWLEHARTGIPITLLTLLVAGLFLL